MKNHDACCRHKCSNDADVKKISKVLFIIFIFMLLELWGHWKTYSLSLLADSLHLLVDISGFIISIVTLTLAKRSENSKMTFGYQRIEIIGAMISIIFIWAACGYLVSESIHKYIHPQEIDGLTFFAIATIGFVVNLGCMFVLHGKNTHSQNKNMNLNMRATYVHVVGDIIQSLGVMIASAIIYFYPKLVIADIVCTLFFALLVLLTTIPVVMDGIHILSEAAPKDINQDKIRNFIMMQEPVIRIVDMKAWSISANKHAISIKILTDHVLITEYEKLLVEIRTFLKEENNIDYVNIEINTPYTKQDESSLRVSDIVIEEALVNRPVAGF